MELLGIPTQMFKILLILISCILTSASSFAQNLKLLDMAEIYSEMNKNSDKAVEVITNKLQNKAKGWSNPAIDTKSQTYHCFWKYNVSGYPYATFRFVVQKVNDTSLPKLSYEFPYEWLYDNYIQSLSDAGAEVMDNYDDSDGSTQSVYKLKRFIFILAKYPKSLGKYQVNGVPSAYFKVLMHPIID